MRRAACLLAVALLFPLSGCAQQQGDDWVLAGRLRSEARTPANQTLLEEAAAPWRVEFEDVMLLSYPPQESHTFTIGGLDGDACAGLLERLDLEPYLAHPLHCRHGEGAVDVPSESSVRHQVAQSSSPSP